MRTVLLNLLLVAVFGSLGIFLIKDRVFLTFNDAMGSGSSIGSVCVLGYLYTLNALWERGWL